MDSFEVDMKDTIKQEKLSIKDINLPPKDKLKIFANLIVDRILEDQRNGIVRTSSSNHAK